MSESFEEEIFFPFEEDDEQSKSITILNTDTSEEDNQYVYCGYIKCCVC